MAPTAPHSRRDIVALIARSILSVRRDHPVRVAIDGVDAAGKTTLADELPGPLTASGREVIRASIDGFHRPRAERLARGDASPDGYYLDSFNHEAIWSSLLTPLGPGGSRTYRSSAFDFRTDRPSVSPERHASSDAVLVFDGVFLLRPELRAGWDFAIFLAVDFAETLRRATTRDRELLGTDEGIRRRYQRRYIPGQRLYLEAVQPESRADIVIDNRDPARPVLRRLLSRD